MNPRRSRFETLRREAACEHSEDRISEGDMAFATAPQTARHYGRGTKAALGMGPKPHLAQSGVAAALRAALKSPLIERMPHKARGSIFGRL